MIKFIFIFLIFFNILYADEKSSATKIVKIIVNVIEKNQASIWINKDDMGIPKFMKLDEFSITQNCEDADILLLKNTSFLSEECNQKPLVVLDYNLFNKYENAVAAFFWKKGRPNIVFIKDRLRKFNIKLPLEYAKYEEDTIW